VQVVNGFVQYSFDSVRKKIAADLYTLISNRPSQLEQNMAAARANYEARKEVEIAKLTDEDELTRVQLSDELSALRQQLKTRRNNRSTSSTKQSVSLNRWVSPRLPSLRRLAPPRLPAGRSYPRSL
jgi:preprotein translocase subunit SecD